MIYLNVSDPHTKDFNKNLEIPVRRNFLYVGYKIVYLCKRGPVFLLFMISLVSINKI